MELKLTKGQQDVLAQFSELAATIMRDEYATTNIGERVLDIVQRAEIMGFTSQSFGRLYDLLHRSGANS